MANSPDDLQVIVPNLHRRYSGVTATNRMGAPRLARLYRAAWFGSDAPEGIARLSGADFLKLWRRKTPLIWHARRNNEMIAGVANEQRHALRQIGGETGGEIVDHDDVLAGFRQRQDRVTSDIAGAAGD